jgi:hypothetical protein
VLIGASDHDPIATQEHDLRSTLSSVSGEGG